MAGRHVQPYAGPESLLQAALRVRSIGMPELFLKAYTAP